MSNKKQNNLDKIKELYIQLDNCYSVKGCDNQKAATTLNSIINRKKYLEPTDKNSSSYVDCKKFISHYVLSLKSKEHDYDEINVEQINKIISIYSPEQKLHLIDLFKRELNINGYSDQADQLSHYYEKTRLDVYKNRKGWKSYLIRLSLRFSYKKRYLLYWLLVSFVVLSILLIPNKTFALITFKKEAIAENSFLNHFSNVVILIFDMDSDVNVKPINFGGVILMVLGKITFLLFIVNFLIRRIFDKILK